MTKLPSGFEDAESEARPAGDGTVHDAPQTEPELDVPPDTEHFVPTSYARSLAFLDTIPGVTFEPVVAA